MPVESVDLTWASALHPQLRKAIQWMTSDVSLFAQKVLAQTCTDYYDVIFDRRNLLISDPGNTAALSPLESFTRIMSYSDLKSSCKVEVNGIAESCAIERPVGVDLIAKDGVINDLSGEGIADAFDVANKSAMFARDASVLHVASYCTPADEGEQCRLLMLYALHCLLVNAHCPSLTMTSVGLKSAASDTKCCIQPRSTGNTKPTAKVAMVDSGAMSLRAVEVTLVVSASPSSTLQMTGVLADIPRECDVDVVSLSEFASKASSVALCVVSQKTCHSNAAGDASVTRTASGDNEPRMCCANCKPTNAVSHVVSTPNTTSLVDGVGIFATTTGAVPAGSVMEDQIADQSHTLSCTVCDESGDTPPSLLFHRPTVLIGTLDEWGKCDFGALLQPRCGPDGSRVTVHIAAICVEDVAAIARQRRTPEWERLTRTIYLHAAREVVSDLPTLHRYPHLMCGCNGALATLPHRLRWQLSRQRRRYYPFLYSTDTTGAKVVRFKGESTFPFRTTPPFHTRLVYLASMDDDDRAEQLRVILTSYAACGCRVLVLTQAGQVRPLFHRIQHWDIGLSGQDPGVAHDGGGGGVKAVYNEPDTDDDDEDDAEAEESSRHDEAHGEAIGESTRTARGAIMCGCVSLGYMERSESTEHVLHAEHSLLDRLATSDDAARASSQIDVSKEDLTNSRAVVAANVHSMSQPCSMSCGSARKAVVLVAWQGCVELDAMDVDVIVQYSPPTCELDESALTAYVQMLHSTVDTERDIACTLSRDAAGDTAALCTKLRWLRHGLTSGGDGDRSPHDVHTSSSSSLTQTASSPRLTILTMCTPTELPAVGHFIAAYHRRGIESATTDAMREQARYSWLTSSPSAASASHMTYTALPYRHDAAAQPVWNMTPAHPLFLRLICGLDIQCEALRRAILTGVPFATTTPIDVAPTVRLCTFDEIDRDTSRVLRVKVAKQNALPTPATAPDEKTPQRGPTAKTRKESTRSKKRENAKNKKKQERAEAKALPPPPPSYYTSVDTSGAALVPPSLSSSNAVSVSRQENDRGSLLLQQLSLLTTRSKVETAKMERCGGDKDDGSSGSTAGVKEKASYASNGASQRVNMLVTGPTAEGTTSREEDRDEAVVVPRPKGQSSAAAVISKLLSGKDRSAMRGLRGGRVETTQEAFSPSDNNVPPATTTTTTTTSSSASILIAAKDLPTREETRTMSGVAESGNAAKEHPTNSDTLPERRRVGRGRNHARREGKGDRSAPNEDVAQPLATRFVDVLAKMGIKTRVEGSRMPI